MQPTIIMPWTRRNPVLQNNANAPTQQKMHHGILMAFMEYKNSIDYEAEKTFAVKEIRTICPGVIFKWMCFKAYGSENPGEDFNPTLAWSTSLAYYKKAISYFMENKTETGRRSISTATQKNLMWSIVW